jgi:hypothetical protein
MTEPDWTLWGRQLQRLVTDVNAIRDEQRVQGAMLLRVDHTLTALLDEFRATHVQIARMNDRIRKLEEEPDV